MHRAKSVTIYCMAMFNFSESTQFAEWVEERLLVWLKHHFGLDFVNVNVRVEENFEDVEISNFGSIITVEIKKIEGMRKRAN